MERAIPILPADDLRVAKQFYVNRLRFNVCFEAQEDGTIGLLGHDPGTISLTLDCPMSGHGQEACVALQANEADTYYDEMARPRDSARPPSQRAMGYVHLRPIDPFDNTLFVMGPVK